jgi:hypothetical protein
MREFRSTPWQYRHQSIEFDKGADKAKATNVMLSSCYGCGEQHAKRAVHLRLNIVSLTLVFVMSHGWVTAPGHRRPIGYAFLDFKNFSASGRA